jgi:hypothetical protein
MTKKEMVLERCRVAGYNGDQATYTRIALESNRVTFEDKRNAYALGMKQKERGYII